MALLYGPFYADIWKRALSLGGQDLLESLAIELSEFVGIDPTEARRRMEHEWHARSATMSAQLGTAPKDEAIRTYYAKQEHGLYVSMYWHSLIPDRWALHSVAALHHLLQYAEGRRVFELGHGVGSTALLLGQHGFHLTLGDVSERYQALARSRLDRRGIRASFINLDQETVPEEHFDGAVSLDVLEHIPDPMPQLRTLWRCLKPGGILVMNIAFGKDPDNPEHVLHRRRGVLDRIRALGFERIPSSSLLVYWKRPLGAGRRALYRAQDAVNAALEDTYVKLPQLRRLLSVYARPNLD